jgi:integrase
LRRSGAKGEEDTFGFSAGVIFYGTEPTRPIDDWKEAWEKAKRRAAAILNADKVEPEKRSRRLNPNLRPNEDPRANRSRRSAKRNQSIAASMTYVTLRSTGSLTVEQFRLLVSHLREPFGTMALVCICFGLRISECLALKWSDVDWLNGMLRVERGIVEQNVDDVKTDESRKSLAIANELLERLKVWKHTTEFPADSDWIFASPLKLGRPPYSNTGFWRELDRAGKEAGIGHMERIHSDTLTGCGSTR